MHPDTALTLPLNVTNAEHIASAVEGAYEQFGGIDVLLNNAGNGYRAAVEEGERDQLQRYLRPTILAPSA